MRGERNERAVALRRRLVSMSAVGLGLLIACAGRPVVVEAPVAAAAITVEPVAARRDETPPVPPAEGPKVPDPGPLCAPIDPKAYALAPYDQSIFDAPQPPVVDPGGTMAPLYEHIASLLRGRTSEPVRIGIYGDSNMTQDGISGGMRRMLQATFGDAGHGYVALGRAWPWYLHLDVKHGATYAEWKAYSTSVQPAPDGYYGFANMAFDSLHGGASTWVETAGDDSPVGRSVGSFDAYFLKRPAGGSFRVVIDGKVERVVSTAARKAAAGFERFDMPDGPHKLEIVVNDGDPVRLFGVALERAVPGVVVDSLGTGALNFEQMTRVDAPTRRAMLERRKYDLVIFLLGSNIFTPSDAVLDGWIQKVVDAHREAVPGMPVLILSPTDIATSMDAKTSMPRIVGLVHQLRRAADATGSAYWDFWSAMGGDRSIVRLRKHRGMASSDLIHLTRVSGVMMGQRIAHALVDDFAGYLAAHPGAGCEAHATSP